MLSATSSINDRDQIHAYSEDWIDNRNELLKQRADALLNNPCFLLLYVQGNGNKMRMIRPAINAYHRERITQRMNECSRKTPLTYYTLSHRWGITRTNLHYWNDIGTYVDDENGNPADPVPMRPEKRNTLLEIFQSHRDSYWWIDVLCARADVPMAIRGDVFACCTQCFAMVDWDTSVITQLNSIKDLNISKLAFEDISCTLLLDYYEQLNGLFSSLTQCGWWNSIWTLQEMALPPTTILMAEATTELSDPNNMMDIDDLCHFESILGEILFCLMEKESRPLHAPTTAFKELKCSRELKMDRSLGYLHPSSLIDLFDVFARSARRSIDPIDYVYGVLGVLRLDIPTMKDTGQVWHCFLFKVQEMLNELMEHQFSMGSAGTLPLITINDEAFRIDLSAARSMTDVYRNFLVIYDCALENMSI